MFFLFEENGGHQNDTNEKRDSIRMAVLSGLVHVAQIDRVEFVLENGDRLRQGSESENLFLLFFSFLLFFILIFLFKKRFLFLTLKNTRIRAREQRPS